MKKAQFIVLSLVLFGLLTAPALAAIDSYKANVEIADDSVNYHIEMVFSKAVSGVITAIPGTPQNVETACRLDKALLQTNVICDNAVKNLTITYTSTERITTKDNWLMWSDTFRLPEPATDLEVHVELPAGIVLKEPIADAIEPVGANVTTDGRHILIDWAATNVEGQWSGSIAYERTEIISSLPTILAVIAILAAVAVVAYKYYFSGGTKESMKIILPVLKKDEKGVIEGLIKHGSGVNQKIIVKESGYSKAKVSKVLKSLGERGLVRLERTGRSNRVFWGKELKKETQKGSGND
jgi:uncharacterized membrane protein